MGLSENQWISEHQNLLITGPTGVCKSYFACALVHRSCRDGRAVLYQRFPRLLHDLEVSHHDCRFKKLMAALLRTDPLVLDDFGSVLITAEGLRDLLDILEDRYNRRSRVVTSQVPVSLWHETLENPTMADAILDRLIHKAYKIEMKGESMKKIRSSVDKPRTLWHSNATQCQAIAGGFFYSFKKVKVYFNGKHEDMLHSFAIIDIYKSNWMRRK